MDRFCAILVVVLVLCLLMLSPAIAQTWVDSSSSCNSGCGSSGSPWKSIGEAVAAVGNGPGTIVVRAGTYTGPNNRDITIQSAFITLRSQSGAANTIMDCQYEGPAIRFFSGTFTFDGFTVQHCNNTDGGALHINSTFTVLRNLILRNNSASRNGGGIYIWSNAIELFNSQIVDNFAGARGGGIYIRSANLKIYNSTLTRSVAVIAGNQIYCVDAAIQIDRNTSIIYLEAEECHTCSITYMDGGSPTFECPDEGSGDGGDGDGDGDTGLIVGLTVGLTLAALGCLAVLAAISAALILIRKRFSGSTTPTVAAVNV